MFGHRTSMNTSAPTPEIRCGHIHRLASAAMSSITMMVEFLPYQPLETALNESTTLCRGWDSLYSIRVQTHVQTSLRYRLHTVK
jgi:hypothetical protein